MGTLIALGAGASLVGGLVLILAGARKCERASLSPKTGRLTLLWRGLSSRQRVVASLAVGAGVLIGVATGWLAAIPLIPVGVLLVPYLLSAPPNREVELLAALDRWIRFLIPSIATGKSIRDAILTTRSQAPELLRVPVSRLVARIDLGWSINDALLAMADDLAAAEADSVLAALALASQRGGVGARSMLEALADNAQLRLRALREIAAERAKPRAVVKQVVLITVTILAVVWWLSPGYFTPYRSGLGQLLALGLAAAYLGCLAILRRRTLSPPVSRFLKSR